MAASNTVSVYKIHMGDNPVELADGTTLFPHSEVTLNATVYAANSSDINDAFPVSITKIDTVYGAIFTVDPKDASDAGHIFYDPAVVIDEAELALPSNTKPFRMLFGGTIVAGEEVITAFSIAAPGDEDIISTAPDTILSGTVLDFVYRELTNTWYVVLVAAPVVPEVP